MARCSDRDESSGSGSLIHGGGHRGSPVGFGRQTFTRTKTRLSAVLIRKLTLLVLVTRRMSA